MKRMEGDITARVPEEMIQGIEALAKAEGLKRADIIRRAIRLLLSGTGEEPEPALSLDEEAWLEIWRHLRTASPDLGRAMMRVGQAAVGSLPERHPARQTGRRGGKRVGGGDPGNGR